MNTETSPLTRLDDRLLDRLVDGELTGVERAEALQALDAEPDGWRRCAAAFLEAQAWRAALATEAAAESTGPSVGAQRARRLGIGRLSAIAAAMVFAFGAGLLSNKLSVTDRNVARGRPDVNPAPSAYASTTASHPPPVRLPVFAANEDAAQEILRQPSALPEYVRRQLEREGYEVKGDRKLVSVAMKDGRQVTVPVETFKYRFVGYRVH